MAKEPPEHRDAKPGAQRQGEDRKAGKGLEEGQKLGIEQPDKGRRPKGSRASTAFDLWLQRELQDMFSDVSSEPLPEELMRLIDESKTKK